jgi:hypothetical protein
MAMSLAVQTGYTVTNDQRTETISGRMLITGTGNYPAGGFPLDSVILALPECTGTLMRVLVNSDVGSGYIWQRIAATGNLMGLQVPPSGSLTTAAPLQQLPSTVTNTTLQNEALNFVATIKRNS